MAKKSGVEQLACNFDKPWTFSNMLIGMIGKTIWGMGKLIWNIFFAKKEVK